jgi:hypothetical protein
MSGVSQVHALITGRNALIATAIVLSLSLPQPGHGQGLARAAGSPPVPEEAVTAILAAFRTHDIVTLADWHGIQSLLDFALKLIGHPDFPTYVNDIVVESANARYQAVMDRYIAGEDVPLSELQPAWAETTQGRNANAKEIPSIFQTVRTVNSRLPRERRLRVLLGDSPIDWTRADASPGHRQRMMEMRDSYPAALIQLEVLARERRALVLYGQAHAQRKQIITNYDMSVWQAHTVVSLVESATPARVFAIWWEDDLPRLYKEAAAWPTPVLVRTKGTTLGAIDFNEYWSGNPARIPRQMIRDGKLVPAPREEWKPLRMDEQFDAVLYLGRNPQSTPPPR